MNKKLWLFAFILVSSAVYIISRYGMFPKPVRLIKPNHTVSAVQAGEMIWTKLRHVIKDKPEVVFGMMGVTQAQADLISGFTSEAKKENTFFANKYLDSRFRGKSFFSGDDFSSLEEKHFIRKEQELSDDFKKVTMQSRSLFIGTSVFSSHLVKTSPLKVIEKNMGRRAVSISILPITLDSNRMPMLKPGCDSGGTLGSGTQEVLGCLARRKSSTLIRKKMDKSKFVVTMEQFGLNDYIVFLYAPES